MRRRVLLGTVATGAIAGCLDEVPIDDGGADPGAGDEEGRGTDGEGGRESDGDGERGSDDDRRENGGGGEEDERESDEEEGENGESTDCEGRRDEKSGDGGDGDDGDGNDPGGTADGATVDSTAVETLETGCAGGGVTVGNDTAVGNETEGDAADPAAVEFDAETVVVTGHLEAPTPCHEAILEGVDVEGSRAVVGIGLESALGEDGACVQCLGRIDYEATVEFDGRVDEVAVVHPRGDGRTEVATESR